MNARDEHEHVLRAAGVAADDYDLWRDGDDAIGAVVTQSGTVVGWLDSTVRRA